jgi:hypothetical protein
LADGAASFRGGSSGPPLLRNPNPQLASTSTGLSPAMADLPRSFDFGYRLVVGSYNPQAAVTAWVWALPRSLATTEGITTCFLFLRVLRCFSSPRWLHPKVMVLLQSTGLPHSDTHGSTLVCNSPWRFAADCVLLRRPEPRHPPGALRLCVFTNLLANHPNNGGCLLHVTSFLSKNRCGKDPKAAYRG